MTNDNKLVDDLLAKAEVDYYTKGESDLTDSEYNQLRESSGRKSIGFKSELNEEELPLEMGSLKYTKDSSDKFFGRPGLLYTDKLDGIAILLQYTGGKLTGAWKRGDHSAGARVDDHIKHCSCALDLCFTGGSEFEHVLGDVEKVTAPGAIVYAKCEAVISRAIFACNWSNKVLKDGYASPRSFVAGMLSRLVLSKGLRDIDIVCHDFVTEDDTPVCSTVSGSLAFYKQLGGKHIVRAELEPGGSIDNYFDDRKEHSLYDLDGLVLKIDRRDLRAETSWSSGCPGYAKAFKGPDEEAVVTVDSIQYAVGRTAVVTPVAWFEPVSLLNTECRKVTGHSQAYLEEHGINSGSIISVSKHGTVIPNHDKTILRQSPPIILRCPSCQSKLERVGDHLVCSLGQENLMGHGRWVCPDMFCKRLEYFYKTLGLENVAFSTWMNWYTYMYEVNGSEPNSLLEPFGTCPAEWLSVEGISDGSMSSITKGLRSILLHPIKLSTFVIALGFPNLGADTIDRMLRAIPDLFLREKLTPDIEAKLKGTKQIGPETVEVVRRFFLPIKMYIKEMETFYLEVEWESVTGAAITSNKLSCNVYYFTGFRDPELRLFIERNGGIVRKGYSKKEVTCVVRSSDSYVSNKVTSAFESGQEVITHQQLLTNMKELGYE